MLVVTLLPRPGILALLNEKYTVTKIQPVDMFPHTLHIENVVQLKLR